MSNSEFEGCTELEKVVFASDENIKTINNYSFRGCTKLTTITVLDSDGNELGYNTFPKSVTTIGTQLFNLSGVVTPITNFTVRQNGTTVVTINANAFQKTPITYLSVPANTKYNANSCFTDCTELSTIVITGTTTIINNSSNFTSSTYKYTPWYYIGVTKNQPINIVIEKDVSGLANYAFYGSSSDLTKQATNYNIFLERESSSGFTTGSNNQAFTQSTAQKYYNVGTNWCYDKDTGLPTTDMTKMATAEATPDDNSDDSDDDGTDQPTTGE
jgi:hypothetical protein